MLLSSPEIDIDKLYISWRFWWGSNGICPWSPGLSFWWSCHVCPMPPVEARVLQESSCFVSMQPQSCHFGCIHRWSKKLRSCHYFISLISKQYPNNQHHFYQITSMAPWKQKHTVCCIPLCMVFGPQKHDCQDLGLSLKPPTLPTLSVDDLPR